MRQFDNHNTAFKTALKEASLVYRNNSRDDEWFEIDKKSFTALFNRLSENPFANREEMTRLIDGLAQEPDAQRLFLETFIHGCANVHMPDALHLLDKKYFDAPDLRVWEYTATALMVRYLDDVSFGDAFKKFLHDAPALSYVNSPAFINDLTIAGAAYISHMKAMVTFSPTELAPRITRAEKIYFEFLNDHYPKKFEAASCWRNFASDHQIDALSRILGGEQPSDARNVWVQHIAALNELATAYNALKSTRQNQPAPKK